MATVIPPPSKRMRLSTQHPPNFSSSSTSEKEPAPTIIVQFRNAQDGSELGPRIALPADTDKKGLEEVVRKLKGEDAEAFPFSFTLSILDPTSPTSDPLSLPVHNSIHQDIILPSSQSRSKLPSISTEDVFQLSFSPESHFLVRPVTRLSASLSGHQAPILCAGFSGTGKWLCTGGGDNTARIWDLETELPQFRLQGHTNWVLCVEWEPRERWVATGSMDNSVRVWDPHTGKTVGEPLKGHSKWITSLAWEPCHINPSNPRLASSSKDCTVRVWNPLTHRLDFALGGHTASVNVVRWGGGGASVLQEVATKGGKGIIYTAGSDRTVRIWDGKDGKLIRVLSEHAHWINSMALNTDFILRTGPFDEKAQTPKDDADAKAKALERYTSFLASKPEIAVTASEDHTLFLWNNFPTASHPNPSPKKPIARLTGHQKQVNHVAFSPDGKWIASAGWDNAVKLWDGLTGKFIASLRGHVGAVYRLSWSSDSRLLVSASKDSTLKLWDLKTYKIKHDLPGHTDEVYCVDFVADKVASGGKDKTVKIWRN